MDLYHQIQESVSAIGAFSRTVPQIGLQLGTGLGNLADQIEIEVEIPYNAIPHFPKPTVPTHKGSLLLGKLEGVPVAALLGRFHYYEGYSGQQITFPVRVLAALGIKRLVLTNVTGSVNEHFLAGDLVFVKDHINLLPENPLRGPNDDRLGPRFPDMLHAYDPEWIDWALEIAGQEGIRAHEGVYVCLPGPNLETPAEYQFIHRIGGDIVGMSTIPEVLVSQHMGVPVFVLSVVTNQSYPIHVIKKTTLESVIETARQTEPKMTMVVKGLLAKWAINSNQYHARRKPE